MKKVNKLRSIIKWDKKNELKEKRSNHCSAYFKKSLEDLDKILEVKVEPMNSRALENKEDKEKNITENSRLTYLSKNKKQATANLKSDSNEAYK
ncbi:hypothetical protein F8M41_015333 [Gigaspora margarita]|uniref:Uncharacterized protein n=1 Tax=Gigaspora margarita TaxID=4874 RepID=A0A8H3WUS9_GIGMA|nr:hypothetical protein F8M41_015333 [Gigaspora margarita]